MTFREAHFYNSMQIYIYHSGCVYLTTYNNSESDHNNSSYVLAPYIIV